MEVDPNDNFNGFMTTVKDFLKRNPRFYILHTLYMHDNWYKLVSVTNTDDYVETLIAYIDRLICKKVKFHNNQLPIHKPEIPDTKFIEL